MAKTPATKGKREAFEPERIAASIYRPFTKMWHYGGRTFNHSFYSMPRIFPDAAAENLVITINANHTGHGHIALMMNALPDLHSNGDAQCFPLYLYDDPPTEESPQTADLFTTTSATPQKRRHALTDAGLAHFQAAYPDQKIGKEDVFYYVYGLLHSPDYRERYADNLAKELPRMPCVKTAIDFWAFSNTGRALANLHVNFETAALYPVTLETGDKALAELTPAQFRVEKMRYGKVDNGGGKEKDLTTLIYNDHLTVSNIPLRAYDYVVNGKPALDWVVERQCVKTDKDSQIVNDANLWATDTMHNPRYPLELVQRVITVSLETLKLVAALPGI
jgi:predicted helicase